MARGLRGVGCGLIYLLLIMLTTLGHSLSHGCGAILGRFMVAVIPVDARRHGRGRAAAAFGADWLAVGCEQDIALVGAGAASLH